MSWAEYLSKHTEGEVGRITAQRLDVTEPTVSRWKKGTAPDPRAVIAFARVYGRPVLEALVEADLISPAEAKVRPAAAPSLDSLTDQELVEEILRRMSRGGEGDARDAAPMKMEYSRAARRGASRGKQLRDEIDHVGEEPQGDGPEFGA